MVLVGASFTGHTEAFDERRISGTLEVNWATFDHVPVAGRRAGSRILLGPDESLDLLVAYAVDLGRQ